MDKERLIKKMKQQFRKNVREDEIRKLMNLAHNRCVDRIKFKGNQYGRMVLVQEESYTSKTCGNCGFLNKTLEGSEIFSCPNCSKIIDRDTNGARNIMIKGIMKLMKQQRKWYAKSHYKEF